MLLLNLPLAFERLMAGWLGRFTEYLGILAQGIAGLGQIGEALATVDQALARADRGAERWYIAELLRIKGELLVQEATAQSVSAAKTASRRRSMRLRSRAPYFGNCGPP
jgi:predicted ATPase